MSVAVQRPVEIDGQRFRQRAEGDIVHQAVIPVGIVQDGHEVALGLDRLDVVRPLGHRG